MHRLAIAFLVIASVLTVAGLRWLNPEPAVYEIATSTFASSNVAVASSPSLCGATAGNFQGILPSLVEAFQRANEPGASLGDVSGLRNHFAIANSSQLAALEAQGLGPQKAGSPQVPLLRLSRVGFNSEHSEALMCIRAPYGSMLIHLRKVDGSWQLLSQEPIVFASLMQHNYSLKRTAMTGCGILTSFAAAAA